MFGSQDHQDDHHVANDSQGANQQKHERTDHFVLNAVVRPNPQSVVELWSNSEVFHLVNYC